MLTARGTKGLLASGSCIVPKSELERAAVRTHSHETREASFPSATARGSCFLLAAAAARPAGRSLRCPAAGTGARQRLPPSGSRSHQQRLPPWSSRSLPPSNAADRRYAADQSIGSGTWSWNRASTLLIGEAWSCFGILSRANKKRLRRPLS